MKWAVLFSALLLCVSIGGTNAQVSCPAGWSPYGARCYQVFIAQLTFQQAEQHCANPAIRQVNDGVTARVAMPKDQGINDHIIALRNSVAPPASCWIGLTDRDNEGAHRWIDGELLGAYNYWAYDVSDPSNKIIEPNESPGDADCVRMEREISTSPNISNHWRDFPCDDLQAFCVICETLGPCEVDKGTCFASGDPHYGSFDNRRYDFQGPCRYTFAKDCDADPDFTVEVQNVGLPPFPSAFSVTEEVYVIAFGMEISLLQGYGNVEVGGMPINLPYHEPAGRIEVHQVGRFVRVRLVDSCVEVFFDGSHQVRVTVPRTYVNDMCGLCGNFNDDPSDDLNGLSEYDFGTSHLTDNATCPGGVLPPEVPVPDCNDTYEAQVSADDMCGLISDADGPFAICHGVVDPQLYFDNCVYDMCAGAPDALCQNMEAYAVECVNEGVPSSILDWRTEDRCPLDCPANSFWSPCATSCPATCVDPNAPDHCLESCVEGCQCEDGFIDSGGACVPSTDCGCVDHYGFYHPLGEVWDDPDNAGFECECTVDGIICGDADGCDPDPCDPNAECTDVPAPGTGATCDCNDGYEGDGLVCTALPCPYLMAPANGALSDDGPYVYLDVVTFTCDEGYSLNGASSVTCLATQLWSDVVPTCDPLPCPNLMAPANGALSPDGPYVYLDVVTFTCDPGYELAPGGASSAMCLADQTWSADVPTCQRVECPYRMAPVNGDQSSDGPYYYGDVVTYSCDPGYELVGPTSATCQSDESWSADVPTCQRVECPTRMAPVNGAQAPQGPYYYEDVVTYSCDTGYELVGASSVTCQADTTWSAPVPTCERVECPYRMAPANGDQSSDGPYYYGDVVTYSCDPGYELVGPTSATCQSDESWSADVPTCQRVECPYRMAPVNGDQSSDGPYYYGDVVTYSCDPGYELVGPTSATCQSDESWSADVPTCQRVECPTRMAPVNGAQAPQGPYYYEDVVTYSCDTGYELVGASSVTCQADTTWSAPVPTCERVECPYRMAPENGAQSPQGPYYFGDEVTYSCDPGYELVGASSVTCQADTTWSATVPTCERVECPYRMAPENGAQSSEGPYYYGDEVTYTCDEGYELAPGGASSVTCQADESWSADVPTCQRVECPYRMAPENGAQSSEGPYYYGDVVTYTCDEGYELAPGGASSVTCQADESWSADVPTCQRVECPYRMAPVNGAQSSEGPYYYGDEVTYSCDEGYELAPGGASSVTCQADETWSADVPTCQRVECPYRMAPENGAQSSEGPYYYEDVVTYSCDQGYGLNGASSVTCQADQTWSATVPTCNAMTRDDLCVGPDRGYCHACGDPHYKTFDRRPHHFQGPCRYIFAKDCGNNDFSVEVQQVPVPRRPVVSVVREVFVIAHGYEIGIHQGNDVTVDGVLYTLPFSLAMGKIRVRFRGIWVHVHLVDLCVDIYYNGRHCVKVKVSAYYYDRMCGLCGNFNNDRSDDFMMSDLVTIATNWNDFGFSWLVQDEDNELCIGPPPPPPCPPELEILANDLCGIITANNGPFAPCHAFEDPLEYFGDCVYDICAQDGDIVGLCDNLEAYADACDDKGVHISWRTPDLCPLPCPPNSHYNPCASPCPPTCQDPNPICIQVCVECCECNDGYIMSGQHCVPIEECGCTDPETGRYYELGETWVQNGRRCECRENNNIVCKGCSFDIVFILDRSSSIGPYGMYIAEKYIAYIIRCLFGVDVEVGYIVFDCISKWLIALGLYTVDTSGLIPQIKAAEFTGGISRSGNAIRHFSSTANFRNGIPKAAIVLTDGRAYGDNPDNLYQYESDAARAMGIEMYAVAVGREYYFDYNALTYIAGGADRVFGRFSCCALAYRMMCDLCVFPPPCDANADLFFVLDGSGSVHPDDFATVKDFVVSVVSAFTISLTDTRVGVVQYSSSPQLACNLGDHPDQQSFVDAITNMVQISGGTATGAALDSARTTAAWRGSPFPKIMIVLTDGQSGDSVDQASADLADDGVIVFAIGVGNFDAAELQQITNNNSDRVFELADYETLTNSIDQIVEALCNGATP
ncbi:IgGFc-binding protein-like isoform X4 [Branchiostoma floridae x Branchiostoma belcheri]